MFRKKLRKLKEGIKNNKGFTLVELIIVIVVLVIIAAIAIPAVISFVNRGNEGRAIADGRSVYMASVMAVADELASNPTTTPTASGVTSRVLEVSGVKGATDLNFGVDVDSGALTAFSVNVNGFIVTRDDTTGEFEANKA